MKLNLILVTGFLIFLVITLPALAQTSSDDPFQQAPSGTEEILDQETLDQTGSQEGSEQGGEAASSDGESGEPMSGEAESADPEDTEKEEKEEEKPKPKKPEREPSQWVSLNDNFEVKRINSADLKLRTELPSNKEELKWMMANQEADKPFPEEFKNFEPLQVQSAIVSPAGKLFLSTNDGLAHYQSDKPDGAKFVRNDASEIVQAASLARDPVDGILIGLKEDNKVLELRDSGKLISRGQLDSDVEKIEDKAKLSVTHVVASGSDYLALSNNSVYRRFPEGHWEKQSLSTDKEPISQFALLESRDIATAHVNSKTLMIHPRLGIARKLKASDPSSHASNKTNILTDSIGNMKVKKLIPDLDGGLFCVFATPRKPSKSSLDENPFNDDNEVTAAGCTLSGSAFDDLVTSNNFDWGVDGMPEKDRTVMDFSPGPSGSAGDVWFVTPEGVGLFANNKTEFWKSQFKLDEKGIELSRIQGLGNQSYMVFTTDGKHCVDVFYIRPKK